MQTTKKSALIPVLVALAACAGCVGSMPDDEGEATSAVSAITIDLSTLTAAPPATIPADRLTRAAFGDATVARSLLGTAESFMPVSTLGARVTQASPTWQVEKNTTTGEVMALRHAEPGRAVPQDDARLQAAATAMFDRWGLHASEIQRILVRRLMSQAEENNTVAPAAVFRHKVFFFRGVNAVPVQGHRAVVTWAPDGALQRVYLHWPAIAAGGHRLRTSLTRAQIQARALSAITAAGGTAGVAQLRWKYVPTATTTGEVTLTLAVSARFLSSVASTEGQESREIDVDVSATQ